ncbi:uncharacterized protein LOC125648626 isoform X2 [Ostrea edulis]|uniref:uncharacterized protein LOC125648626 isoform X2 n=1 Tax=Ostrea edulis TaxID=37623 RepID=UPI0024AFF9B7|nr:uncharacterized protein LOC125648626 isoform X2 [Ostrea edulis]
MAARSNRPLCSVDWNLLWIELLPGIEEFLCQDLAREKLSEETENKRLYYLERLDILKLPPSVPPRLKVPDFGAPFSPSPTKATSDLKSPTLSHDHFLFDSQENDFAAHQREISRSFIAPEELEAIEGKEVKVYDDIDLNHPEGDTQKEHNESKNSDDTDLYEIPVIKNASSNLDQSAESGGYEETKSPAQDDYATTTSIQEEQSQETIPPPLPPRREKSEPPSQKDQSISENTFPVRPDPPERQSSIKGNRPPDLPARPNLPTKSEIYNMAEKKDERSEGSLDLTDEAELTSYESCNEDDQEIESKLNIKLPKPMKKKKSSKPKISRSSKEWDVTIPYKCLEDVTLSGELMYKGKLSWTRKLAALTDGRMVCYKPEKSESKPAVVIQLTGYEASYLEKENRKGFDVRLLHPSLETHMFSVDFKDWAQLWVEYMNAMSKGKPPPGQYQHLTRGSTFNGTENGRVYGSKPDLRKSISNISTESSNSDTEYSSMKRKSRKDRHRVSRMGSIASRASSFFESIGKSKGKKMAASLPTSNSLGNLVETGSETNSQLDLIIPKDNTAYTTSFNKNMCHSIEDLVCDRNTLYQGYLNIYSSFNKRKWGKRWCVVRGNVFECYRVESSTVCELQFPLRPCVLKQAMEETKSELGLMISENDKEKVTVEPLNREDMACWLRVFMNQTTTDFLPDGLREFWVDDESPYHDIQTDNLSSPLSDVFPYDTVDEKTILTHADTTTSDPDDSVMSQQSHADPANDSAMSNPRVPGELTGELYTQVQRTSNGLLESRTSSSLDEEFFSSTVVKTNFCGKSSSTLSRITKSSHNGSVMTKTFTHSFSTGFLGVNDSSLFNEILSKLSENHRHESEEDSAERTPTDTAYNSAAGSENSSLERKNKFETDSSSHCSTVKDYGSSCDELDNQTPHSNMEYQISIENMNSNEKEQNRNVQNTWNGLDNSPGISNAIISSVSNTQITDSYSKSNRDQCDSAIFESDSFMDDLSCASPDALKRKIEQLRTHLVELKQRRICLRDRKLCCEPSMQNLLEQEYSQLDEECRTVTEEILALEGKLEP